MWKEFPLPLSYDVAFLKGKDEVIVYRNLRYWKVKKYLRYWRILVCEVTHPDWHCRIVWRPRRQQKEETCGSS